MKKYSKIALLVVSVIFLTLTACTLPASKPPAVSPTPTGEAPFPVFTSSVGQFGTQTVIAQTPVSTTPQVTVATFTPAPGAPSTAGATQTPQAQPQTQPSTGGVAVNTPVISRPTTYTLQKGEWPICIARRYNLDIPSFFAANGLNMNSKPAAGTTLNIPASGSWNPVYGSRSLKAHPATISVAAGQTLNSIACDYGDVAPESILAVNGLAGASAIQAGMSLKIP